MGAKAATSTTTWRRATGSARSPIASRSPVPGRPQARGHRRRARRAGARDVAGRATRDSSPNAWPRSPRRVSPRCWLRPVSHRPREVGALRRGAAAELPTLSRYCLAAAAGRRRSHRASTPPPGRGAAGCRRERQGAPGAAGPAGGVWSGGGVLRAGWRPFWWRPSGRPAPASVGGVPWSVVALRIRGLGARLVVSEVTVFMHLQRDPRHETGSRRRISIGDRAPRQDRSVASSRPPNRGGHRSRRRSVGQFTEQAEPTQAAESHRPPQPTAGTMPSPHRRAHVRRSA